MALLDWGAFARALATAAADLKANRPLETAPAPSADEIVAFARAAEPYVTAILAGVHAHPGAIRAPEDLLEALKAQGFAWAGDLEAALAATPGALAAARDWLPRLIFVLTEFAPAPVGLPGG